MDLIVVYLEDATSSDISVLVRELKDQGYKVGVDFDFEFSTGKWDYENHRQISRRTKFTFYNKNLGILFSLRNL
jgi:ribulose bisphosphate carboxylase small subunit